MTPLPTVGLLGNAMAEEFENYEARMAEARRAVERWEADGGAGEVEQSVGPTREDKRGAEQTILPDSARKERRHPGNSREGQP
jgi:hypothetical protein